MDGGGSRTGQSSFGCAFACECVPLELWPKSGHPPAATMFLRREALIRKGTAVRPSPIFSLRPTGIDSESGQGDGWRTQDWTSIRTMLSGRAALSGQGFSMTGGPAVRTQPSPLTAHVAAGPTPVNPWDSDNRRAVPPARSGLARAGIHRAFTHRRTLTLSLDLDWRLDWAFFKFSVEVWDGS